LWHQPIWKDKRAKSQNLADFVLASPLLNHLLVITIGLVAHSIHMAFIMATNTAIFPIISLPLNGQMAPLNRSGMRLAMLLAVAFYWTPKTSCSSSSL
jgi:hypothetical protein